jgi:hypothetical protein
MKCCNASFVLSRLTAATLLVMLGACVTVQSPQSLHIQAADPAIRDCAQWFQSVDAAVEAAGVRDREAHQVSGFPYLRSTRFLSALQPATGGDVRQRTWLDQLRMTDLQARAVELRNLPEGSGVSADAQNKAARCGELLMAQDLANPVATELLAERVKVPDAYSDWLRVVGIYGLTRIPFAGGVAQWHAEARAMFERSRSGAESSYPLERYAPGNGARYSRAEVAALLGRADPALGILKLAAAEEARLFATYAPVFEVETTGDFDRPGAMRWGEARHPLLDTGKPVVYQRLTYTRYGGRTLVQLVYTMWFSERPVDKSFDILAGGLDGLVWRVTLGPDGEPLVFDTMHPCGCYHMFFPTPLAEALPSPDPDDEWAFIPAKLQRVGENERIRLRIATRSHYLIDVGVQGAATSSRTYGVLAEAELQSLPLPGGGFRSIYGADALVQGTERGERFLFWPMGIPSAGAMRQWGNHATAFLGRRHFDDADLIERRFRLTLH